jgi:MoxR-like ATPase
MEQPATTDYTGITEEEVRYLQTLTTSIDLSVVRPAYIELVQLLRNAGVLISDRRAVKLQRLIAASALLCNRRTALRSDLWVLRYIWDIEEQQEVIAGIVNAAIATDESHPQQHPRANINSAPDADTIYEEILQMAEQWETASGAERSLIKDRLRYLNGRTEWISSETQRNYVLQPIEALWQKIIQTA